MKSLSLTVVLAAAALGFIFGRHWKSPQTPVAQARTQTAQAPAPGSQAAPMEPTRAGWPTPETGQLSNKEILRSLSKINPGRSFGGWREWGQLLNRASFLMSQISTEQFPGLLAEISKNGPSGENEFALSVLADEWTERAPEAALAWVSQLPQGAIRELATMFVGGALARRDPRRAMQMLDQAGGGGQNLVICVFSVWGESDPAAAAAYAVTLPAGVLRSQAISTLVSSWGWNDPQAATAWVSQLPENADQQSTLSTAFSNWGRKDPKAAVAYLEKLPEGRARLCGAETLCYTLMRDDPAGALKLLELLPPGEKQDSLLSKLTSRWVAADPEKARDWAKLQTDEHVQTLVWPAIATGLVATDPAGAAALALSLPEDKQSRRSNTLAEVAKSWATKAPVAAADYFLKLPEGPESKKAVMSATEVWAKNDPEGATRWLDGLALGGKRDLALEGMVSGALNYDPAKAGNWALRISDPGPRERMLSSVAKTWMRNDPEAAERWMAQPAFPAKLRQKH